MQKIKKVEKIIKLTNDCIFKRTFADEKEPENLFHLLNAIQEHRNYPLFESLEIKNPILFNDNFKSKTSILDIKAQDKSGQLIDIEMQMYYNDVYIPRTIYYNDLMYTSQLPKGQSYGKLNPCININLVDFIIFPEDTDFHSSYLYRKDDAKARVLSRHKILHYIELPKIDFNKKELNFLEKWLYLIVNAHNKEDVLVQALRKEYPPMDKTLDKYEQLINEERIRYEAMSRDKWLHDQATMKEVSYERGLAEGKAEGLAEGKTQGLAEGKTQGLAEGESKKSFEIARNLKTEGFDNEKISKLTGLSIQEIEAL